MKLKLYIKFSILHALMMLHFFQYPQAYGQTIRCYTTEMEEQMYGSQKPAIDAQFEEWMARKRAEMAANPQAETGPRILPTVVHIIYRKRNSFATVTSPNDLSHQSFNAQFLGVCSDTVISNQ